MDPNNIKKVQDLYAANQTPSPPQYPLQTPSPPNALQTLQYAQQMSSLANYSALSQLYGQAGYLPPSYAEARERIPAGHFHTNEEYTQAQMQYTPQLYYVYQQPTYEQQLQQQQQQQALPEYAFYPPAYNTAAYANLRLQQHYQQERRLAEQQAYRNSLTKDDPQSQQTNVYK